MGKREAWASQVAELRECAHQLVAEDARHRVGLADGFHLNDQAEDALTRGPLYLVGVDTWETWSDGDRDCAWMQARAGFLIRLAELQMVPAATDHDHYAWASIGDSVIQMAEHLRDVEDGMVPVMAAAAQIAQSSSAADAVLHLVPGPAYAVRRGALDEELLDLTQKGVKPAGMEQQNLVVFGYVLSVLREFVLVAQERGDAEREGRAPNL